MTKRSEATLARTLIAGLACLLFALALPAFAGHHEGAKPGPDEKGASCGANDHCQHCEHCQHQACSDGSCPLGHGKDGQHGQHGAAQGMSHGHGAGHGAAAPSPEARAKMAEAHERLAACLRSTRPVGDCHAEMKRHHGAGMGAGMGAGKSAGQGGKPETSGKPDPSEQSVEPAKTTKPGKPAKATN